MLSYLLKSGVCLAVFYLFYKLLLEKEPIHFFKRIYLLGGLVLAFAIPLITFTTVVEVEPVEYIPYIISEIPVDQQTTAEITPINYWPIILWTVYGFGVVVFGLKFFINLLQIGIKVRRNTKKKVNQFTHVLLQNLTTPHTFFSYIFLNKQRYIQHQIPQEVFWHEETHAKQKHSFDVVLVEILQVVFWFNPLLYYIKKDIKLNHEFLADRAVLNKGVSLNAYQEILLAFSSNQTEPQLANALNYSSIKKRFTIMKTKTSKKSVWIKSLILLPLIAVLVYSFSEQKVVEIEKFKETTAQSINTNLTINNIEILIHKDGNYLVNEIQTSIDNLKKRFNEINPDITIQDKENITVNIYTDLNTKMASVTDLKMVLREYGIKKVNISGARNVINQNGSYSKPDFQDKATYYQNVTFIFRDANKNIISTKKYTELTDEEKRKLLPPRKVPTKKSPTQNQLNEWKNSKKYGVWLDGKRIENKLLNDIKPNEIVLFYNSKLAKNAINYGKHYYQIGLYTDKKFDELYKDGIKPLGKGVEIVSTEHSRMMIQRNSQTKATTKEIVEYNKLAKEYNKQPEYRRIIKLKDLNRLEYIFNKMTTKQKNNAEPFPNLPPPPESKEHWLLKRPVYQAISPDSIHPLMLSGSKGSLRISMPDKLKVEEDEYESLRLYVGHETKKELQDKATKEQIAEYNKLAKHYNNMSKNDMVVKVTDINRLSYIYKLMTKKQKQNAEPFPNFPPPPPPVKIGQEKIIEVPMKNPPPPPIPEDSTPEEKAERLKAIKKYAKENPDKVYKHKDSTGKVVEIVEMPVVQGYEIPPPPPPSPSQKTIEKGSKELQEAFKKFSESAKLYGKSVKDYRSTKKGLDNIIDQFKQVMKLHKAYRELATEEGVLPTPPPPPPPSKKKN